MNTRTGEGAAKGAGDDPLKFTKYREQTEGMGKAEGGPGLPYLAQDRAELI